MPKFLNNAFLVTQSAPSTPTAGGVLYASGSSIFFKNSTGTEYNLTGSKGYVLVTEYTQSGGVWNVPSDAKYVKFVAVGGGGSGAGGARRAVAAAAIGGGGGGAGGEISIVWYPIASIPSAPQGYAITVSGVTNGGAGATTNGSNGTVGTIGGTTSLISGSVTLIRAGGGQPGTAGSSTGAVAGGGSNATPTGIFQQGPLIFIGQNGGGCNAQIGRNAGSVGATTPQFDGDYHARNGYRGTGGGGGGGGSTATPTAQVGGSGSGVYLTNGTLFISGSPGAAGTTANSGSNGANNVVTAASLFSFSGSAVVTSSYGFGGGGHGAGSGNTAGTLTGGRGGDGGYFGAGGGGGGGAYNQNGGRGGDGAGGYLAILEYY